MVPSVLVQKKTESAEMFKMPTQSDLKVCAFDIASLTSVDYAVWTRSMKPIRRCRW